MRIGILHGWLLSGSGSSVYTQNIARTLHEIGHEIELFCQDRDAGSLSFVSTVRHLGSSGITGEDVYRRRGVTVNIPDIGDTLPVFVWDRYARFERVVTFLEMSAEEIEEYVTANVNAVLEIHRRLHLDIIHANHAVMMPLIARRVHDMAGIPYIIALHGSGLVYAVEKNDRLFDYAVTGLERAGAVVVGNNYFKNRVGELFVNITPSPVERIVEIPLGVDVETFRPIDRSERHRVIETLSDELGSCGLGRTKEQTNDIAGMFTRWADEGTIPPEIFNLADTYSQKHPDQDAGLRLRRIDWTRPTVLFVGRLIPGKGPHDFLLAYLDAAVRVPCQAIIVGAGPLREWLEFLVWIRRHGRHDLLRPWLDVAGRTWGDGEMLRAAERWISDGNQDWSGMEEISVNFTGFLDHRYLRNLFPCGDVAVFPSLVPESFGLVVIEAAASGVVPLVTDFSGLRDSAVVLENHVRSIPSGALRFGLDPEKRIGDISFKMERALSIAADRNIGPALRSVCERFYSWPAVASSLAETYADVIRSSAGRS